MVLPVPSVCWDSVARRHRSKARFSTLPHAAYGSCRGQVWHFDKRRLCVVVPLYLPPSLRDVAPAPRPTRKCAAKLLLMLLLLFLVLLLLLMRLHLPLLLLLLRYCCWCCISIS